MISNVFGGWVGGWVYGMIIIPLRGPSCKRRFARISDKLKFQDGPIVKKLGVYDPPHPSMPSDWAED